MAHHPLSEPATQTYPRSRGFAHLRGPGPRFRSSGLHTYLLFVSVMPFASALVANNWDERLSAIFYGSALFLAAAAIAGIFLYATGKRRLVAPDLSGEFIRRENGTAVWLLSLLGIGAALGYFSPIPTYAVLGPVLIFHWTSVAMNREGVSARRRTA